MGRCGPQKLRPARNGPDLTVSIPNSKMSRKTAIRHAQAAVFTTLTPEAIKAAKHAAMFTG
jgi:hypothetical protein